MVKKIIQETDIKGVQFGTLNLEKSVQRILEGLKWAGHALAPPNQLIVVSDSVAGFRAGFDKYLGPSWYPTAPNTRR